MPRDPERGREQAPLASAGDVRRRWEEPATSGAASETGPGDRCLDASTEGRKVLEIGPRDPDHLVAQVPETILSGLLGKHDVTGRWISRSGHRSPVLHEPVELENDRCLVEKQIDNGEEVAVLDPELRWR